jgi:hypothetical protein
MSDNVMSRRSFLAGAGLVLGAAAIPGVAMLKDAEPAAAAGTALPWAYPGVPAEQPVPEALARRAFEMHRFQGFACAEAVWWPFVEFLTPANPGTWGTLPQKMFQYGGQGIGGWGTICGTLNAAAAILGMTVANGTHKGTLTDAIFMYYSKTALPTNDAWKSYQKALGLTTDWTGPTGANIPIENAPTSIADSPLCHSSLVQWTMVTNAANGGALQKDRCAKACFDVTLKLSALMNAYFAAITPTATPAPGAVSLDPAVQACGACHVTYTPAKMACGSCHDNGLTDGHMD